jgi:Mg-chelatase subunit ChlD
MRERSSSRRRRFKNRQERGIAILVTTLSMILVIPTVGLAIDAGFLYAVRAKLSAATDAAALAAARSLSVGLTLQAQAATAEARARAFFDANFPDHFLNTTNKVVQVEVAETAYRTRTVTVTATVEAPVYFMRLLGFNRSSVAAEGKASRRDVNLILVLDRSGSMAASNSCEPMKAAARQFVSQFANGRDRLGLVTFGMTYLVAYPPAQNFKTSSPTLDTVLSNIQCSGGTGTAQALWKGYEQLQAINEPGSLNLIVFFTDGLPNGITALFPVKTRSDTRYGYGADGYSSTGSQYSMLPSTCRDAEGDMYDRNAGASSAQYSAPNWNPNWNPAPKLGVLAAVGNATTATGGTYGITFMQATSLTQHNETPISDSAGCRFASNGWYVRRDIAYIPDSDYFGNATSGYDTVPRFTSGVYSGKIRPDKPDAIGKASKNAADNAARRMRQDPNLSVVIYTIGLGDPNSGEPPDEDFMKRVANDPSSPVYASNEPTGLYVFAPNNTQLNQAFARVASEILRIAR